MRHRQGFIDYEGWRSTYQDKDWIVEAIFFDLNGDGFDEVLLTFPNQRDRMGSSWRFLSTSPKWQRPKRHAGDVFRFAHSARRMLRMILWAQRFIVLILNPSGRNAVYGDAIGSQ